MSNRYRMSEAGHCLRALVADKIGYEPVKKTVKQEIMLKHASKCEQLAAEQMTDEKIELVSGGKCLLCSNGENEFFGIHTVIDCGLFKIVGHVDRKAKINCNSYPVEIKSLGRWSWNKFRKEGFGGFPEYAAQMACYLEAERLPGLYWVMNRDNGEPIKLIVNDRKHEINLPDFTRVELSVTIDAIYDRLLDAEVYVASKQLPEVAANMDACKFCGFKYLCQVDEKVVAEVSDLDVVEAARLYCNSKEAIELAEEQKEMAVRVLIEKARNQDDKKFKVLDLISFSYRGSRTKRYLDQDMVKTADPVLYAKALKETKPFEDYTVKVLRGE